MSEVASRKRFTGEFGHLDVLRWRPEARQAQKPDYSSIWLSELASGAEIPSGPHGKTRRWRFTQPFENTKRLNC